MKRSVEGAFNEAASEYDAWVRQALPTYDELFAVAVELVRFPKDYPLKFANLGAGTGLFSARVLDAFPNAVATLYDAATEMLGVCIYKHYFVAVMLGLRPGELAT